MKINHLRGLIAAPFTPLREDGSLELSLIPIYFQFLKSNHVTGAFICGSTGEGASLTLAEKKAVAEAWANCTKDDPDFRVMSFLGGTSLAECGELALHAREIGLYGVSFTAPFYFKPANVHTLVNCCKIVAASVPDMPFYYYHIPGLTGVNFPMIELLKAVDNEINNFAGIKFTHEDFMDYHSCVAYGNGKYDMLWGRDECMLPALAVGAKAAVGSTFNYAAPLYYELIDAFECGDVAKARILQSRAIEMIRLLGKYGGMGTGKAYMKLVGLDCGAFRLPVGNMSQSEFNSFQKDAAELSFDSFKSQLPQLV